MLYGPDSQGREAKDVIFTDKAYLGMSGVQRGFSVIPQNEPGFVRDL